MHFGGVFCTDMKCDGSFVPVVPSKTIPVPCFQICKAWLHSTVLFRSSYRLHVNLSHNAMPKGGRIGRKQSVLKKNCQKKKSKLKGVQKQKKLPVELARKAATEITFVSEDDVVSEKIPPPAASASLRKIGAEYTESSSDESIDPKGEIPEGYRLVSMDSLKEFARRIHSNSQCASGEIIIFSYFYFCNSHSIYCKMCFYYCCSRPASSSLNYFFYFSFLLYNLRSDFPVPRYKTVKYGKHSIRYLGPHIWGKISQELRSKTSLQAFRKGVRALNAPGLLDGTCGCCACSS